MRKQIASARWLIPQLRAESVAVDRDEHEIVLVREVPRDRFPYLLSCRKMEVPINNIDGGAREDSGLFGFPPERFGTYLIDDFHEGLSSFETLKEQPECELLVVQECGCQAEP